LQRGSVRAKHLRTLTGLPTVIRTMTGFLMPKGSRKLKGSVMLTGLYSEKPSLRGSPMQR
jgi:hypothetical protein